ncbi:unnamed protein product [Adineta ricciae]|uniref:Uncharacterized protein n=1 Tax=Adineta ricciae TaxID=249248 RepID=A0A813VQS3_ADIRI|nr:unnamed protein product [Adineta ricciae]CAF1403002.1 unnamed protein product [Adineta ricciae]
MKNYFATFNHPQTNQCVNTNAADIARLQCERKKCESERQRLRKKFEQLQQRRNQSWTDRCCPCCRRSNRNRHENTEQIFNEPEQSVSYQPEREFQSKNTNDSPPLAAIQGDMIIVVLVRIPVISFRLRSNSVIPSPSISFGSLESSSDSAFPTGMPTSSTNRSKSNLIPKTSHSSVNNYEKSLLTVPENGHGRSSNVFCYMTF